MQRKKDKPVTAIPVEAPARIRETHVRDRNLEILAAMTCIVAVAEAGSITFGADSAGVGGLSLMVRADRKVFKRDGYIFGFTSSFRMGQLLQHKLQIPKHHPATDLFEYMCSDFIDAVRRTFSDGGYRKIDNGVESGGQFIVGHAGRIFEIESDFQVGESAHPFAAVGCGFDLALGSLHTTRNDRARAPRDRITAALEAAHTFSAGVRPPFHIEQVNP